jgi:hypothetical protein
VVDWGWIVHSDSDLNMILIMFIIMNEYNVYYDNINVHTTIVTKINRGSVAGLS